MKALAIVERGTKGAGRFWDVVENGHTTVWSSSLLAACEAYVVGWQRGCADVLASQDEDAQLRKAAEELGIDITIAPWA